MNGQIERHTSVSITSDPNGALRRATITQTVVNVTPAPAVPVPAAPEGFASSDGGCFDINTCCDDREKAMIEMLRAYLRPAGAPECLIERLHQCLRNDAD